MTRIILGFIVLLFIEGCNQSQSTQQDPSQPGTGSASPEHGRELFAINCATCHRVKQDLTGPALNNVEDRWPDKKLLYGYIHNSQEVIKENKYPMDLYFKWNKSVMPPLPNLSDDDIGDILKYIEQNSVEK